MAQRRAFPLRLEPSVYDAVQRWADAEMRSMNAQIEYLLRRELRQAGRLPQPEGAQQAEVKREESETNSG